MTANPVLALDGVSKSFGPIEVVHAIDLALYAGEVHALIGENGAGKSTAMKIMAGYQPQTTGKLLLDGEDVTLASLQDGEQAGIVMIHQEFNLAEQLTVEQNIFLGRELKRGVLLDKAEMRRQARALLDRLDCTVDPQTPVSKLSNSDKQMVEIAKALSRKARVLIMDEPTAVLTHAEAEVLFEQVRALKAAGTAILFTSHKLDEVALLADRVTIMRDGSVVHHGPGHMMSEDDMATAMVGRDVSDLYPEKLAQHTAPDIVLRVTNLNVPGYSSGVSFELRAGEILGVGGLIGSGRTETMEGLVGLRHSHADRIEVLGKQVRIRRPSEAQALGLSYLTEDRKLKGLILGWQMTQNLTLATLKSFGNLVLDNAKEEKALSQAIAEFDIRAGTRDVLAGNLSGGNQQKLLLAKVMLSEPRIVIVDEPTRGIDIGTKQQIYSFLRRLAAEGHAIIMVSSEMAELIGLADRIMVMRQGRVTGMVQGQAMNEQNVVRLAMGLEQDAANRPVLGELA